MEKFNRLLQIEEHLAREEKLEQWEEHRFPLVKPPTPIPLTEEDEEGLAEEGSKTPNSGRSSDKK